MILADQRSDMRDAYVDHESALGAWRSYAWKPEPSDPLFGLVDRIWHFDGYTARLRERHFPDGRYTIVVQFGTPHRPIEGEPYERRFPSICFGGMNARGYVIEAPPDRLDVLGIVLTPLAAHRVLAHPLDELAGFTSDLSDSIGRESSALERRLHDIRGGRERVRFAREWIGRRLARGPEPDPAIAHAFAKLDRGQTTPIATLRAEAAFDKSRFIDRFKRHVGVTPKRFGSLVRVRTAIAMLGSGTASIADVAIAAGFYDQAHFTNDMRRLAGMTPGDYVSARRYPGSASVAEAGPNGNFSKPRAAGGAMLGP